MLSHIDCLLYLNLDDIDEKKRILIIIILYIFALEIKYFVLDMKST